ncbi:2-aminoethanethiol dioxygenase [Cylas formicarius]|uniref:2-aminoethanethiol dioxygenase n=1 Tax=Cylas formicarius TaxID=197179 RepID=UPI0029589116|nr:2-aminoethanethiol dioxygenase [Cylas formicarius]
MTNHLLTVLKQAITTFTSKNDAFCANLQILLTLLDKINVEHVNLLPQFMTDQLWNQPGKAPVTCIEIYEDENVSMGIFILKPDGKLPLHNHPDMHGLIKVIAGKVKITSYSINTEKTKEVDLRSFGDGSTPIRPLSRSNILTAELVSVSIASTKSAPCVLEPHHKNLHEIQSLEGPAAFLDILAPPYDSPIVNNTQRQCSYFTKLSQVTPGIFRLKEIRSPSWYWTDSCPYTGPPIDRDVKI